MPQFITLPEEVAAIFGTAAPKFVDFLVSSFSLQQEDVIQMSALQFESTLGKEMAANRLEIAGVRLEIADLRTETQTAIAELRTETRSAIAELRAEMKTDSANVQRDLARLHGEISGLHRDISTQTKWILTALTAAVTLYPIMTRLVLHLIP